MSGKTNTFKVVIGDKSSKFLLGFVAVAVVCWLVCFNVRW